MENIKNYDYEGRIAKEESQSKRIVRDRWILLLVILPMFYAVAYKFTSISIMLKVMLCATIYNSVVTMYIKKEFQRATKLPEYFYYVDAAVLSLFSFLYGGIQSDVYVIFLLLIAFHGVINNLVNTMKLSFIISGIYSFSCILEGLIKNSGWIFSENIFKLLERDLVIIILTYAIGLVISEVKKSEKQQKIEYTKARTDKLTGLPNRHFMEQKLEEEILDCDKKNKVLNVLIFDIDNFKKYNDTYGHLGGDEVLKRFAEILAQSIRRADLPVRYGGEEFIILVKDIDFITAKSVGDRVRKQLEKEKLFIDDGVTKKRVTVSCGVAQYPTHSTDIKQVIEYADKALYCAKENGKNIVIGYDELLILEELRENNEKFKLESAN